MEILVPRSDAANWEERLRGMKNVPPLLPFEEVMMDFIQSLSSRILKNQNFRKYPELMAMSYWLRKAHLHEIQKNYETKKQGRIWLPRGLVLHFAPSNVDTIFVYSWFLSMLVGNYNVVRISQRRGEQINLLLELLSDLLQEDKYKVIAERTLVVSYGHDEAITQTLSDACNVRVIWGGDETIRTIRKTNLPPRATEMVFANRFSMSAIQSSALLSMTDSELMQVANDFYNDAYWFDQMACSSPRLVMWVGADGPAEQGARSRFWRAVKTVTVQKGHYWQPSVGMNRLVEGYSYASQGLVTQLSTAHSDDPYRATLKDFSAAIKEDHCGGGFFFELAVQELSHVLECLDQRDQTLATFGFSESELTELAWRLGGKGIDRIVPIGRALDFNEVWDGYDLLAYLTREVVVQH